jgi:hypothetical protein
MEPPITRHDFTLPLGYVDAAGDLHADGTMRLATVRDQIEPLADPAVKRNEARLGVLRLARTVTRIGGITDVTGELIEDLFAADFDHLQRLYEQINTGAAQETLSRAPAKPAAAELPISEEAASWLAGAGAPTDLVPLLGEPTFPPRGEDASTSEQLPQSQPAAVTDGPAHASRAFAPERALTTIQELPRTEAGGQPLLRLARTPVPAPALASARPSQPQQALPADGAHERPADLDVDEIYDEFLQRLRRDLLHDRERLGDLLGPIR